MTDFTTDYLIVGAGAVGLAFADTLLDEDPDCHITFVDKHARPGGHWNDAYSFVALHQPSAFYGVNSMAFPSEQIDDRGPNKGLYALASGAEVTAYFERVMNHRLLPSGRVAYHRLSAFTGREDGGTARIRGVLSGEEHTVTVRRKLVDATFYQTSVPSTHKRAFAVDEGVAITIPGGLPDLWKDPARIPSNFVILGGGKTAMDTGVWLIETGVAPDRIHWVRPRDSWLNNRKYVQPGEEFLAATVESQIAHLKAFTEAEDGHGVFEALERGGYMLRIDPDVRPEMYHYAVISEGEIALLRQITQVIRTGRVTQITRGALHFGEATHAVPEDALFIDCTARAVPFTAEANSGPQFRRDTIVLQPVHVPLVTFSAAVLPFGRIDLIGHGLIMAILAAVVAEQDRQPTPLARWQEAIRQPLSGIPLGLGLALVVFASCYTGLHGALYPAGSYPLPPPSERSTHGFNPDHPHGPDMLSHRH